MKYPGMDKQIKQRPDWQIKLALYGIPLVGAVILALVHRRLDSWWISFAVLAVLWVGAGLFLRRWMGYGGE